MIKSVGQNVSAAIEASRLRESGKARTFSDKGPAGVSSFAASASPAARMAAEGAPVDMDRVAAIKAAIASGNYPVDPAAIADKMLALDLPVNG
ncbi:negative regulator of flagellin synthesis FlgM [Sphingobium quisquiliarum P25]|uniref:Negative regulator of flagellin synthesis n=1 Tax=Sphingobium quisquiliarum P25 TaxID=1329909 RepID=T0H9W2_9SPHN|nr:MULTISPECIES: flagellar biosynthesis anti-sigma factor FlgM [Sphingobium]EQB09787.1 negative regulator of flagellin synthesis FlgM [Sphingobium quisquiliarum P25]EZP73275.1 Negative regulator of flagellin synthesis FlgM [Sphingomonas paucimobilis]